MRMKRINLRKRPTMGFFDTALTVPISNARFSECRRYRYILRRIWDKTKPVVCWIMVNPSTAGARVDDQTIRKCVRYAKSWGYGGIVVVNLFAYRSRDPSALRRTPHPISEPAHPGRNDQIILKAVKEAGLVMAGWGENGVYLERNIEVLELLDGVQINHLGLTRKGNPGHPLFLPKDAEPLPLPRRRR
jgi:hypothetical protein